jgi:putative DNA primase/helicase
VTSPYAARALEYWKRSWRNPIPVKGKSHPVKGYTGYEGADVSWPDIQAWLETHGTLNIAVRALGWVGIDVDDYDGKTGGESIRKAQDELGELPATWTSTSRGPGQPARIRFFKVPVGTGLAGSEKRFNSRFGDDVDIIHRTHRYAIVAPSIHPETGQSYRWYTPDGDAMDEVPDKTLLPDLPDAWLEFLTGAKEAAPVVDEDDLFEGAVTNSWSRAGADREIAKKLDGIRTMDRHTKVNEYLGGAARFIGHFVPALLTSDEAARRIMDAVAANEWHSDAWNAANGKKWTAASVVAAGLARGETEPWEVRVERPAEAPVAGQSGGELPPPSDPMAVARALVPRMTKPRTWWRGDFYSWQGTHWEVAETSLVERWLYRQTEHAVYVTTDAKGEDTTKRWAPTKKKITDLVHALGVGALQRSGDDQKCIAAANGVLRIEDRALLPHSPERFNLSSLPFAYDPDAQAPAWLAFLDSVLPGDRQAQEFLGEWFGYVLSGHTNQQKMAALIGERRSGKGTIARVLTAMLGQEATAGLDLNLVAGNFGLENLIGKSLAVSGDVRWHSRNVGDAVPVLLGVIGEDTVTVHRKNRASWNGRLGVRFMLMSNETPTFSDRSGALGGRMIYVKFSESFYGREDIGLTEKLLHEMPGILNWALDGLDRLNGRGRFTEPESGRAEADAVRRLSDPLGAFLDDWCEMGPGLTIGLDHLYLKYQHWCESEGRTRDSTTKEIFSRDLRSKVKGLDVKRTREGGRQVRMLHGVTCAVI